jgi:hypothetical protein
MDTHTYLSSKNAMDAARQAAQDYGHYAVDRDPLDGEHVVPGELRRFLAQLRLLQGVPFSYLVPDARLLPLESMRFFYMDRAWTDALVQGALSVGTLSSADRSQLASVYQYIQHEVDEAEREVRSADDGTLLSGAGGTITGFVLRSRAVSGWPNLHVRAYTQDVLPDNALSTVAESDPRRIKVLRQERLAPAVLLVLFDGVPAVVHVEEPRQGLQFGVRLQTGDIEHNARLRLRDCATGTDVGAANDPLTSANSVAVPFRANAPGVIDMAELRRRLAASAPNSGGTLEPNEFALQMLRFPWRQVFGDPKNTQHIRDWPSANFKVSLALSDWKQQLVNDLAQKSIG